jgi:hypothetical protein
VSDCPPVAATNNPDRPPQQLIEVWLDAAGTTAECACGWRVHMPAGVLPQAVMSAAEAHESTTGHRWPTGETD